MYIFNICPKTSTLLAPYSCPSLDPAIKDALGLPTKDNWAIWRHKCLDRTFRGASSTREVCAVLYFDQKKRTNARC